MAAKLTDKRGLNDERTITVPLEAFALLMAWTATGSREVPPHIKAHPAYPDHHGGRRGHLLHALEPFKQEAFRALSQHQGGTDGQ